MSRLPYFYEICDSVQMTFSFLCGETLFMGKCLKKIVN